MSVIKDGVDRYTHFVFWGHKSSGADFHYIYMSWSRTLQRLGLPAYWVDDDPGNAEWVQPGCWVTVMDTACKHLPVVDGVDYVLHNFDLNVDPINKLAIQVYTDEVKKGAQWGRFTHFDGRCLYQPWGTDLMPHEFMDPVCPTESDVVYWMGSIWNNELGQGNDEIIHRVESHLGAKGLRFEQRRNVSNEENAELVRASRFAPAFTGKWQAEVGYIPCRVLKNISYGQLGVINSHVLCRLGSGFHNYHHESTIEEMIDLTLGMPANWYKEWVRYQQDLISGMDYASKMRYIFQAFDEIKS